VRTIRYGSDEWAGWLAGLRRSGEAKPAVRRAVTSILADVRERGDAALVELTARFDGMLLKPGEIQIGPEELRETAQRADPRTVAALREMARRLERYHRRQLLRGFRLRLPGGGVLEERVLPLPSIGLYVPGGSGAYPSSVLMNAIPARVAGVPRVVVVTPPRMITGNPAVAAALEIAGLTADVYRVGGAHAVAALAYGTDTVPAVTKIVGPGNAYVAEAKRQVRGLVEIDNDAGPSEVAILADDGADPELLAADLLAQAEHGSGEESAVLVTPSERLAVLVLARISAEVKQGANVESTRSALAKQGAVVIVRDLAEGVAAINALAPEHVQVMCRGEARLARQVVGGAVFVGRFSPVAAGDYGVGPNHVLPTGGSARFSSPLGVHDFQRRQPEIRLTERSLGRVAESMATVADAESFPAHARSLRLRLPARRKR
jgi:histidinol dehydrogenase